MSDKTSSGAGGSTETLGNDTEDTAFIQGFRILVEDGADAGASFVSKGARVAIGRHRSTDVRLTDESVSLFHCEIEVCDDRLVVRDLRSRNGTVLDGVAVREAHPRAGSILALGRTRLRLEVGAIKIGVPSLRSERFHRLVGRSRAMQTLFATLARAAQSDATLLLEGETGSGKEAVAESVHAASPRRDGPFHVIDCGAIPSNLLEAELFGYEKGAFTGATARRTGIFEAADGGTVLLDEIGEIPLELQPKLLRVLEKRHIKRVGSNQYVPVDCRVIAATLQDLRAAVNHRRFRSDLFFRLAVIQIWLPPLRERVEDIPLLVDQFLHDIGATEEVAARVRAARLDHHHWPGNVRELRNYIERCVALGTLEPVDDGTRNRPGIDVTRPWREQRERWLRYLERQYIEALLHACGNNASQAARTAGMDRASFYRLMWRVGLR
jgi:two-component system, NtrC family, response regulator GlrR